jgi:hypothetical protein
MLLEHLAILEEAYKGKKEKESKKATRPEADVKALAAPEAIE